MTLLGADRAFPTLDLHMACVIEWKLFLWKALDLFGDYGRI